VARPVRGHRATSENGAIPRPQLSDAVWMAMGDGRRPAQERWRIFWSHLYLERIDDDRRLGNRRQ
jgi:hypothetical protein